MIFEFWGPSGHFLLKYGLPEAQEASKNLPGARGSVFPKYQPVATHGDPIHPQNYLNLSPLFELVPPRSPNVSKLDLHFLFVGGYIEVGRPIRKRCSTNASIYKLGGIGVYLSPGIDFYMNPMLSGE